MMTIGGTPHIIMLICSIILLGLLMFIVSRVSHKVQCIMIHSAILVCMLGILFLHLTHYGTTFDFENLFVQMFQVCNFNLILLPLCLIKKNELARQYLFFFSMPAAASTFFSYPSDVSGSMWYSIITLNFWLNHFLIVAIALMMVASKWLKPGRKYVLKVCLCIFAYFMIAFCANYILNGFSITGPHNHSYTMGPGGILALKPLYKLIPIPFIYLIPTLPIIGGIFYLVALIFEKIFNKKESVCSTS